MSELYETKLKTMTILIPLFVLVLIIFGIISAVQSVLWQGFVLIGVGVIMLVAFIFMRRHLVNRIAELKQNELIDGD